MERKTQVQQEERDQREDLRTFSVPIRLQIRKDAEVHFHELLSLDTISIKTTGERSKGEKYRLS